MEPSVPVVARAPGRRSLPRLVALACALLASGGLAFPSSTSTADKPLTVASAQPASPRWAELERFLAGTRGRFRGSISYYVEDLQTGQAIAWNEKQQMPAASIIKLPIAVSVFEQDQAGKLSLEDEVVLKTKDKAAGSGVLKRARSGTRLTVQSLLELMLQRSDNTATNILTDLLGLEEINAACRRQGLATTCMPRYIMDLEARDNRIENYTSAADMARLLKGLYGRRVLDAAASERLLEILKGQHVRDRLPRYLPADVVVAHKTGLMKDACHDVGILYGRNHHYVVAVLTTGFGSFNQAKQAIGQVGRAVWQYDAGQKLTLPPAPRKKKAPPARTRGAAKTGKRRG